MPNGVICGGAVDGSNQLGEIVTCQAITTRPDGASAAAAKAAPATVSAAATSHPSTERKRKSCNGLMRLCPRAISCGAIVGQLGEDWQCPGHVRRRGADAALLFSLFWRPTYQPANSDFSQKRWPTASSLDAITASSLAVPSLFFADVKNRNCHPDGADTHRKARGTSHRRRRLAIWQYCQFVNVCRPHAAGAELDSP